ncbi:MAG: hypothetical protein Q8R06_17390 [Polaromonas sp.]|uniref:hypothetical protein n=1 Tax=Polaromonas sp. TaxID=1869339 RepID=UPI002734FAEC|nr:hypothetical protein [Polaromonas sp.]MDP3798891.1 hypothetical protein [Polaromonas sp.]
MFEKIVLRRSETGAAITAGQIAEALLFYQNVHLVIDLGSFGQLIRQLGPGTLLSILRRSDCTAVYCEETLGTHSQPIGSLQAHSFVAFALSGHDGIGMFASREERVVYMLRNEGVSSADAKRFAKTFLRAAPVRKLSGDFYIKGGITAAARRDLDDQPFVLAAVNKALGLIPGAKDLGSALKFDILDSDLGMYVFNNIDFQAINSRRAGLRPPQESITSAHLLSHILEARADLALASFYGGDFVSSEVTSSIIQLRYDEILRRRQLNESQRSNFHEVTLPDYPSLRETIDSGQRSFKDFLVLLDKGARFKEWLKSVSVDEGLVRSYMKDVAKEGWIQSVPSKTVRYVFTAILDAHNPLIGTGAAVADNFIVDKLLGGWRPNHFVENRLGTFLQQ